MSLDGIRNFIKNVIPQIAAMDGETGKLGDSPREVTIMNRLLANASPEEKDFVQKFLDGEPVVNPQERNSEAVVKYDISGADMYTKKFMQNAEKYAVKYDEDGRAADEDIFLGENDEIVGKSIYSTDADGNTVVRIERNDGSVLTEKFDASRRQVDNVVIERTDNEGNTSKEVVLLQLTNGQEIRVEQRFDDKISVMLLDETGSGYGQYYNVVDGVVKISKEDSERVKENEYMTEEERNTMKQIVHYLKPAFEKVLLEKYNLRLEIEE